MKEPHGFCETPEVKCSMNYCNENGCQNRKRNLVEPAEQDNWISVEERLPTEKDADENGNVLMYANNSGYVVKCITAWMVVGFTPKSFWQPLPHPPKA